MARLTWVERAYETGVDRGVIFYPDEAGTPWNGLISVQENPSDRVQRVKYRDGVKIIDQRSEESFSATVESITNPIRGRQLSGGRQLTFSFSYRTKTENGWKIHLIYNALARPSGAKYEIAQQVASSFDISTTPMYIPGAKPSAHLIIDTANAYPWALEDLEGVLYGNESGEPRMPAPQEVIDIFEASALLRVTDNLDGTFTVDGPDEAIIMLDENTFEITWPSAIYVGDDLYKLSSL